MSLDETGIYVYVQGSSEVYGSISQLYYLYYNNDIGNIGNIEFNGFATTSPGTQPLPESMCILCYITICVPTEHNL